MIRKEGPDTPPVGNRWSIQAFLSFPLDPFFFFQRVAVRPSDVVLLAKKKKEKNANSSYVTLLPNEVCGLSFALTGS